MSIVPLGQSPGSKNSSDAVQAVADEFAVINPNRHKHPSSAMFGKIMCYDQIGSKVGSWGGTVCYLSVERGKGPCFVVRRSCDTKPGRGSYYNLGHLKRIVSTHINEGMITMFFGATPTCQRKDCSVTIKADKKEPIDRQNLSLMYSVASAPKRWREIEKNLSASGASTSRRGKPGVGEGLNPGEGNNFSPREPEAFVGGDGGTDGYGANDGEEESSSDDDAEQLALVDQDAAVLKNLISAHQAKTISASVPSPTPLPITTAAPPNQQLIDDDEDDVLEVASPDAQEEVGEDTEGVDPVEMLVYERFTALIEEQGGTLTVGEDGYAYVEGCSGDPPDLNNVRALVMQELQEVKEGEESSPPSWTPLKKENDRRPDQQQQRQEDVSTLLDVPNPVGGDLTQLLGPSGGGTLDLNAFKEELLLLDKNSPTTPTTLQDQEATATSHNDERPQGSGGASSIASGGLSEQLLLQAERRTIEDDALREAALLQAQLGGGEGSSGSVSAAERGKRNRDFSDNDE